MINKNWIKDWILSKQDKNLSAVYTKPTAKSKRIAAARIKRSIDLRFKEAEEI